MITSTQLCSAAAAAVVKPSASRALFEARYWERRRDEPNVKAQLIAHPVNLPDPQPEKQNLDAHSMQVLDSSIFKLAGDPPLVAQDVLVLYLELALAVEVDVEAAVLLQEEALDAVGEEAAWEVVLLEELVRGRGPGEGGGGEVEYEEERGNEKLGGWHVGGNGGGWEIEIEVELGGWTLREMGMNIFGIGRGDALSRLEFFNVLLTGSWEVDRDLQGI